MVRLIALALACLSAPAHAQASPEALAGVRARLEAHPEVRMEFVQTRTIVGLAKPIVTRGRLFLWHKQGVLWQVEQPYRVSYAVGQDVITEIAADGTRTVRTERDAPAAARISRAVRAAVGGDASALNGWFETEARLDGARWQLTLTPRQTQLARQIKTIRLGGGEFLEDVRIDAVNGDETRIEFRNHQAGAPTEQERRAFFSG
jgi:hypothetical protein